MQEEGVGLPKIEHLGLMNAEYTNELCTLLPRAKVLQRLQKLSLALGTLSDEGARILAMNRDAFAHLDLLDLEENYLSEEGQRLVQGLCKEVRIGNQKQDVEDERYVSVSE